MLRCWIDIRKDEWCLYTASARFIAGSSGLAMMTPHER
jgi:hypothetical protein